jgi:hypothetical protein
MTWARLDDQSTFHAKVVKAGNAAWGACCRMITWSSSHLTDGRVPSSIVKIIATDDQIADLIRVKLLTEIDLETYEVHDFLEWNASSKDVKRRREDKKKAGKIGGFAKARNARHLQEQTPSTKLAPASRLLMPPPYPSPSPAPLKKEELRLVPLGAGDPTPTTPTSSPSPTSKVQEVFDHYVQGWQKAIGTGKAPILDRPRTSSIQARLKEGFSVDDLKKAIDGLWLTPWNMGENPDGKKFIDVSLVCRNASQVERFRAASSPEDPWANLPIIKAPNRDRDMPKPGVPTELEEIFGQVAE